jgi:hypothetical protein
VERSEDTVIPKIIFKYNPACQRNAGRPEKRWKDKFLI